MIFPGFPGVLSFFQVFQVEWEPCSNTTGKFDEKYYFLWHSTPFYHVPVTLHFGLGVFEQVRTGQDWVGSK